MELDRSYAEKSELQLHEVSSRVEPARKTKTRRFKNTRCRGLTLDLRKVGIAWGEVKNIAQDKGRWKATVVTLCPPWKEMD